MHTTAKKIERDLTAPFVSELIVIMRIMLPTKKMNVSGLPK